MRKNKTYQYLEDSPTEKKTITKKSKIEYEKLLKSLDDEEEVEIEFEKGTENSVNLNINLPTNLIEEFSNSNSNKVNFSLNLSKRVLEDILSLLN